MRKLLFLFLLPLMAISQVVPPDATPLENIQITNNIQSTTATNASVQESNGVLNRIPITALPITLTPVNYSIPNNQIISHLAGIDTRLGQIGNTTAGITNRIYFTGDNTTVTAGTFFSSNATGKGTVPAATPTALVNADNQKQYFDKDLISIAQASVAIGPPGNYTGQLSVSTSPTPNGTSQRYTIEIYKCNNGGTPIASGVTGAPVGDLGVTVVAILDSGLINLVAGSVTNISLSGTLASALTLNVGERLRYHVSGAKVGSGGGNITMNVYYGSNYNSFYDVTVSQKTSTVINDSSVAGTTASDALNTLNAAKANDSNTVHKTGDIFTESLGFPPLLSYNTDTSIGKRLLEPESTRLPISNTTIYCWGDSLTGGGGGTNSYPYQLNLLNLFTISNQGVPAETSTQIKDRMIASTGNYDKSVIIWAGRNNYTSPATVKADIATMVASLTHTRYLIVGVVNGDYADEYLGTPKLATINQLNSDLKALYGNRFVDIRPYLVSLHNNSAQDLIDFANDVPPTSLRATGDPLHYNILGNTNIAQHINQRLGILFGQNGYLQSKDFKAYFKDYYDSTAPFDTNLLHTTGNESKTGGVLTFSSSLTATANNQLVAPLVLSPTINSGGFTGVRQAAVAVANNIETTVSNTYNVGSSAFLFLGGYFTTLFTDNVRSRATGGVAFLNNSGAVLARMYNNGNWVLGTGADTGEKLQFAGNAKFDGALTIGQTSGAGALNFAANGTGFGSSTSIQKTANGLGVKSGTTGGYTNLITNDIATVTDVRFPNKSGTIAMLDDITGVLFSANRPTSRSVTTGERDLICDNLEYEIGGSNYNTTTGTFTAPVNGIYNFNTSVYVGAATVTAAWSGVDVVSSFAGTTNGLYKFNNIASGAQLYTINGSVELRLNAGDTVKAMMYTNANVDIGGAGAGARGTRFSGRLLTKL